MRLNVVSRDYSTASLPEGKSSQSTYNLKVSAGLPPPAFPSFLEDPDGAEQQDFLGQTQRFRFGLSHRVAVSRFHEGTANK